MHFELTRYQYLDGSIQFRGSVIDHIGAAARHSAYTAVAIGNPIDRPLSDKIRGYIRGRRDIAAVLLDDNGLIDGQAAGLPRHDLPGRSKHSDPILESINGEMKDIQADCPRHRIIDTMRQISPPHMVAVLVSYIQKIRVIIAHL